MRRPTARSTGPAPADAESTAAIRRAIIRLTEQREQAAADAGRALVTQAEVTQSVRNQRAYLARVVREIDAALALAADAAARARSEAASAAPRGADTERLADDADAERLADAAAAPYEHTGAALRRQREVVTGTAAQLEHLDAISAEQIARTRELLRESVRSLDAAIREQLRLLVEFERIERKRIVAAARWNPPAGD